MEKERKANLYRWAARIWTIPLFMFALAEIILPDENAVEEVPPFEYVGPIILGLILIGLAIAWMNEKIGIRWATFFLIALLIYFPIFVMVDWMILIFVVMFGVPIALFYAANKLTDA